MLKCNRNKLAVAVTAAALSSTAIALEIEEVIVTATKRAQSVQDIPYNISAVSGDLMERTGVTDMAKLSRSIAGVAYTDKGPRTAGAFANTIAMRGMNIDGSSRFADRPGSTAPTVATYVGEAPLFTSLRLKDIERVEVLRGPQGTLYGSGAMGGIVRLIPKEPSLDQTEVKISTNLSKTSDDGGLNNEVDLLANLPVSDSLALRLNLGRVDNGGFVDTPNLIRIDANDDPLLQPGSTALNQMPVIYSKDDVNDEEVENARISALWEISDDTHVILTHHMQRDEIGGRQGDNPTMPKLQMGSRIEEPYERDVDISTIDFESDLGFATMTVAVATSETEGSMTEDATGLFTGHLSDNDSLGGIDLGGIDLWSAYYGRRDNDALILQTDLQWEEQIDSIEIRFSSNGDGPFSWIGGITYLEQVGRFRQDYFQLGRERYFDLLLANDTPLPDDNGGGTATAATIPGWIDLDTELVYFFDNQYAFEDKAVFGEVSYQITDNWQVTGGMRYFEQTFTSEQSGGLVAGGAVSESTGKFEESDSLYKLNTSYNINDDTMLFLTWAEGFRRGGANAVPATVFGSPVDPELFTYEPDTVKSLEVGIKGRLGEGLNYTVTAFSIDWDNPQINTNVTDLALIGVRGGGKAENKGVELELKGQLSENLLLNAGYSYVDSEMVKGTDTAEKGEQLPVPEVTASLGLDYFQALDSGLEVVYHLGLSYRDETPSNTIGPAGSCATCFKNYKRYDSFALADASVAFNAEDWSIIAYVDNLSDEEATVGGNTVANNDTIGAFESVIRPRTLGVKLSYSF